MASTEDLDRQIRILVAQLAGAAPPAPPMPSEGALKRRRRRKRLSLVLVPGDLVGHAGQRQVRPRSGPGAPSNRRTAPARQGAPRT